MSPILAGGAGKAVEKGARRLRFPTLFAITVVVFLGDLVIPDAIPFIDEVFLALLTALMGMWRERRSSEDAPEPET